MNLANNTNSTSLRGDLTTPAGTFFNNFLQPGFTVSQNINDAILGYFEKITSTKESARIMASAIIYTSLAQRVDPMAVLVKFQGLSDEEKLNFIVDDILDLMRNEERRIELQTQVRNSKDIKSWHDIALEWIDNLFNN